MSSMIDPITYDSCGWGYWSWLGIPLMWFWMLGIWAVFVVVAFFVYKDAQGRGQNGLLWALLLLIPMVQVFALIIYLVLREERMATTAPLKSAPAILEERYARGEITRDEFLRMKEDMREREA